MPDQEGDKSQEATPHRRQQAREQGQVAKSQDLGSAVLLMVGLMCVLLLGGGLLDFLGEYSRRQLGGDAWLSADPSFATGECNETLSALARTVLPIFGILLVGAVGINVLQIGFLFLPEKLAPDLTRLDPLKGLRRLFSLNNAARLAFGIFKILVIALVAFLSLYQHRDTILGLSGMAVPEIAQYLVEILLWTAVKIGLALFVLALLDYGFQRWKYEQDIRMTPREVREEMKNLEGNPEVIARRRQVQRQLALSRLSEAVPKADVVITNPTELAVAVQYEPQTMAAPIVVAKGAGVLAQRIRKLALEHGIPIVEKKPLAQALYRDVEINHPIPEDKYAAVAEVLAYVYQLQGKAIPTPPTSSAA
jgi:flagellar biosynthetic protein FlhB